MARTSRDPRTTDTKDLSASLQSNGRSCVVARVLNLCEGGMLVTTSSDLKVAETTSVELSGPGFHYAGLVKVAHREDGAMGLRFLAGRVPSTALSAPWSLHDCADSSSDPTTARRKPSASCRQRGRARPPASLRRRLVLSVVCNEQAGAAGSRGARRSACAARGQPPRLARSIHELVADLATSRRDCREKQREIDSLKAENVRLIAASSASAGREIKT